MPVSIRKIQIYILTTLIIFQDTITSLSGFSFFDYFDETLILCFGLRAFVKIIRKKSVDKNVKYIFLLTVLFWLTGVVGCLLHSRYMMSSLMMASLLMVKIFILIMSLIICPLKESSYTYFIDALLFLGKASAITGIVNFCIPSFWANIIPTAYEYERHGLPSVMGLFIHAGQYGWFMLVVGLIYYTLYRTKKHKPYFYKFIIYAILACLSMKVKVVLGVGVVIFFDLYVLQKKKIDIMKIVISIATIALIFFFFGEILNENFNLYFTANGGSARYAFLAGALAIVKDYFPLGVGFSKFGSFYAVQNYSEYYYTYGLSSVYGLRPGAVIFGMDTFWPAIMGETGFLGTIFYSLLLLFIFRLIYGKYKVLIRDYGKDQLLPFLLAMFIFVQALVESMGEPIFNSSPQNIVIGLIIGTALSYKVSSAYSNIDSKLN